MNIRKLKCKLTGNHRYDSAEMKVDFLPERQIYLFEDVCLDCHESTRTWFTAAEIGERGYKYVLNLHKDYWDAFKALDRYVKNKQNEAGKR